MRGLVPVEEVMASLPKARRKTIEARGQELLAAVERRMTLAELRKGRKLSQAKLADALGIGQMQISRLEKRKDPRLSTMQRSVAAMGGYLTMIATFPGQEPVILVTSHLEERTGKEKRESLPKRKSSMRDRRSTPDREDYRQGLANLAKVW
jgi:transcriptional regulator with XRE-family HTH domain